MTTTHFIVMGLVALAAWIHRHKLLGVPVPAASPATPSIISTAPASIVNAAETDLSALLSLAHKASDELAHKAATKKAADDMVAQKAASQATLLYVAPPAPAVPTPAPAAPAPAAVPNA